MRELTSVIWMACKDLRHDARMTVCLVLTVAAIALPLLLFFGLKNGVVEVMRQRMINDPSFMEVIPQGTSTFEDAWFEQWRQNAHVGFVVPKTRELGVGGVFSGVKAGQKSVKADMQPTGAGDWLLQSYRVQVPQGDQCVLTATLAQKLGVQSGEQIEIKISRQRKGGGLEYGKRLFTVLDVLPQQASGRDFAFIPLEQLENMEAYRDGFGVEAFGWPGEKPLAYPVFYAGILYTKEPINAIASARLRQRTGFARMQDAPELAVPGWHATRLEVGRTAINLFKVQEIRNVLRGQEYAFVPLAGNGEQALEVHLSLAQGGVSSEEGDLLELSSLPMWASSSWPSLAPIHSAWEPAVWADIQKIPNALFVAPAVAAKFPEGRALVSFSAKGEENLSFSMHIIGIEGLKLNQAMAAPGLVARLNLLFTRPLEFLAKKGESDLAQDVAILLGRQSYSRFRMYAKSLDDVAPLAALLEKEGVIVKTRVADIERVRRMDQYLSLILGLIAGAAMLGGAICLLASLYASVERKRRSLAVLRLLGIHGSRLCAFPLTAGLVMTGLGMVFSLLLFHGIAFYMNLLAQDFILPGEVICRLQGQQQLWAVAWAVLAAVVAGLAAALRLLKIEASESLRDE